MNPAIRKYLPPVCAAAAAVCGGLTVWRHIGAGIGPYGFLLTAAAAVYLCFGFVRGFSDGLLDEFSDGRKRSAARRVALFPLTLLPMAAWVHYGDTDGGDGAALFITLLFLAACLNMAVYYTLNRYLTN